MSRRGRILWMAGMALVLASPQGAPAADTALETVELRIRIVDFFKLEADTRQAGIVDLPVTLGERQALDTARVTVQSNLERPYQILQHLGQELMSERGFRLQEEVLYSVSNGSQGGRSEVSSPQPLTSEPTVIFSSPGGSDQFTITYFVSSDKVIPAGRYRGPIVIEEKLL